MKINPFAVLLSLLLQLSPILCASAEPVAQSPQPALAAKIDALAAEQLAKPGGVRK